MEDARTKTDLVSRLRSAGGSLANEAADELLHLRAEILRLRGVNHKLADQLNAFHLQIQLKRLLHA